MLLIKIKQENKRNMIRSKFEKSIGFSRIHYLWYSIILLFPPVHEYGHAAITILSGDKVISFGYWYVTMSRSNVFQELWQYSPFISLGCVLLWGYYIIRKCKNPSWVKGVKFYGSETKNNVKGV